MTLTLIQMTLIMACGASWRYISPAGLSNGQTRQVLTSIVFYFFLPALIVHVLYSADVGLQSFEYSILGVSGVFITLFFSWISARLLGFARPQMGAVLLAASFPNVIYLGLPLLEKTFGSWASSVAIQINFFAIAPLVYTLGVIISRHYGEQEGDNEALLSFLKTPPFCAVFVSIFLNVNQIPIPLWLLGVLQQLSAAVVPLMLFSLGLSLSWNTFKLRNVRYLIPVVILKLVFMPLLAVFTIAALSLKDSHKAAAVIEMAMPSMLVGIILCDQYKLDSELYAMAVTVTTLLSMLTLPFWYQWL